MNAVAGNGDDEIERLNALAADLQAQRAHLLAEVSRLRQARNEAIESATAAQRENAQLRARITELEGNR